jgi:hypothetical protein
MLLKATTARSSLVHIQYKPTLMSSRSTSSKPKKPDLTKLQSSFPACLQVTAEGVSIAIQAKPGAKQSRITGMHTV